MIFSGEPARDLTLHDTVDRLSASNGDPATAVSPHALVERWVAAVSDLTQRIEHVYLIEFLMFGMVDLQVQKKICFLPQAGSFDMDTLVLRVGSATVVLSPSLHPEMLSGLLTMRSDTSDLVVEIVCDLRRPQARWLIDTKEKGFRKLISRYLPAKLIDLNEALFKDALNDVLSGPQPIFSQGPDVVRARIGQILDQVTSDERRRALAIRTGEKVENVRARVLLLAARGDARKPAEASGAQRLLTSAGQTGTAGPSADGGGARD